MRTNQWNPHMLSYAKLIKLDNLLLIAFAQLCVKYGLFMPFDVDIMLSGFGMVLLIIATTSLVAAANVILEIQAQSDQTSKKLLINNVIPEKIAYNLFIIFNSIGVLIGFYLSYLIGKPKLAALFIVVSALFYMYATYLKEILILKNVLIALMASLSIVAVGIFDLLPAITTNNQASQKVYFLIILDYAIFGFVIVCMREIIKDCIHIDADHNSGSKTIPIALGKIRTSRLISGVTIIPITMVVYYMYTYFFNNTTIVIITLILFVAPLLLFMFKSWNAEILKDFKILSVLLKSILFLASSSLVLYQFILK